VIRKLVHLFYRQAEIGIRLSVLVNTYILSCSMTRNLGLVVGVPKILLSPTLKF